MKPRTLFYLEYLAYRAAFAQSSFAPYLRPLSYGDWLQFFDVWSANRQDARAGLFAMSGK